MVNFLGEKEVTVKFLGENKVTVNFLGKKEVTINFLGEKEVMVKTPRGKEAMVIDEDPFTPVASINIVATDSRAMLNGKKVGIFSPTDMGKKCMDS